MPERPHFVVTGCARSGTTYTAQLLSSAGCSCTHESVFGPHTTGFAGWGAAQGDSSWLAVPFLGTLPPGTVVVHQVREPLAAVDALVRFQIFSTTRSGLRQDIVAFARYIRGGGPRALLGSVDPRRRSVRGGARRRSDFVGFLRAHCPEAFAESNEVARAARHWVVWNDRIERDAEAADLPYLRVRLEQLDAATLASVVVALGGDAGPQTLEAALEAAPRDANKQPGGRSQAITRQELGDPLASTFESAAARYGYAIEVP